MVRPNMFPEDIVSDDTKSNVVKDDVKLDKVKDDVKPFFVEIDVGQYFRNETLFITREHMLEWVRMEAKKLEFGVVFRRSDNGSNRRYKVCEDKVIVRDIFWTHPKNIKLFNTFPNILIIGSTYKTNKYRLLLLGIVSATSTKKTFSVGFAFLESEKEVTVTWALEMCKTLLKEHENMSNVIVTD
ncbi:protein FAR1-RELATED SEQUENCE 5-like [Lathyrus oleraceus]|uniref:protein FAR1-RELATED SEQUENCE 5-like n=1 Tax=Pisum sativum TaxID=3888 RepID=UPI0021CF0E2C|nr:protein FAR1-RELATED SEQUENCE 5-like [Pisum sativum]